MVYRNFKELINSIKSSGARKRVAVAAAQDEHTLQSVLRAREEDIAEPILIGNKERIKEILDRLGESPDDDEIIDVKSDSEAAKAAVELIHKNRADFIMKGKLQTADLLKAVVNKEHGLRTGRVMSHFVLDEIPNYHKLVVVTDGGMMMYPNLEEKKQIIENAVSTLTALGYEAPKVAVLAAVENVNPKMPESVDAELLKEMNQRGEIKNCIIEGPISYDLAMNSESAIAKGYSSPVAGDADILIVPNITAGNILGKCLIYSAGARMAGFIVGARVPIALTSRGSSAEEKYLSLVLSSAAVKQ